MTEESKLLIRSCEKGITSVIPALLADPKCDPGYNSNKAIKEVASEGRTEIVKLLLKDPRVNPAVENNYPIRWASENGHLPTVALLLKDPRVNPADEGNYALRWATVNGRLNVAKLLISDPRVSIDDAIQTARNKTQHDIVEGLEAFKASLLPDPSKKATIDALKQIVEALNKLVVDLSQ